MHSQSSDGPSPIRLGELVGTGRTAEVFTLGNGRILKLFRSSYAREVVRREKTTTERIGYAGLPCPAVFCADSEDGLIEINGRYGIIFERVVGRSMLHEMAARPWRIARYAQMFADLHARLHQAEAPGLPRQRARFEHLITQGAKTLPPSLTERILAALAKEPDGTAVCHGDLHPDNVLLTGDGPRIIDWEPSGQGCPAADAAWTVLLLRHGGIPPNTPWGVRLGLVFLRRIFLTVYLREIIRKGSVTRADLRRWLPIAAAARLGDGIPEERDALLRILARGFSPDRRPRQTR